MLHCHYGVQYKTPKPLKSNNKKVWLQRSRKRGCLAQIEIHHFNVYPEYSVHSLLSPDLSQKKTRKIKEENLKSLRESVKTGQDNVKIVQKCYIKLPTEEAHHDYHSTRGLMGLSQRVHPQLCKSWCLLEQ